MKGGSAWAFVFPLVLSGSAVRAGRIPLDPDRMTAVESPFTLGQGRVSFDFQHVWTDGKTLPNERMPIAELGLRAGVLPRLDLRVSGLFNNSDVVLGPNRAYKRF